MLCRIYRHIKQAFTMTQTPTENKKETTVTCKKRLYKKAYNRRYYQKYKDSVKRRVKEYYAKNKEKERRRLKEYYAKNREKLLQRREMRINLLKTQQTGDKKTELQCKQEFYATNNEKSGIDSNIVEPINDESGSVTKDSNIVNEIICRPFLNAFGFSYDENMNTCTHKMCTHKGLTYCSECGEWGSYIDSLGGAH
jgi:hypothetical protein